MESTNEREPLSVRIKDLNEQRIRNLIDIYGSTVGSSLTALQPEQDVRRILEDLARDALSESRYGSRLSVHSKFRISPAGRAPDEERLVSVFFDPNCEGILPNLSKALRISFTEAVNGFFTKEGIAFKSPES